MSRRFNISDAAVILKTNTKTLKNWLKEDGIDIEKQRNRADSREKYLTEEQILAIAKEREIDVRLPDERKSESTAARILTGMDERFAALDQQMSGRFDQLTEEIRARFVDLQRALEEQLTDFFAQIDAHLAQALADLQTKQAQPVSPQQELPIASPPVQAAKSSTRPSLSKAPARKKSTKKTAGRLKRMPFTLTPLLEFTRLHQVPEKAVEHAVERGKLPITPGPWKHNNLLIKRALDPQGRQQFYVLFSQREGFRPCEHCPHTA